jgi:drug/metabolite transporter (DMT)-like permease
MMPYVYLISSVLFVASTNIIGSFYNRRNAGKRGVAPLYNLLLLLTVFTFWTVLFLTDKSYDIAVLPYALLFALCYTMAMVGSINALKTGSVMLTSLFGQLSLIGASVWGFFFWDETFTTLTGVGLLLTVVALWLCLYGGRSDKRVKLNLSWIGYVLLVFLGNAGCTIVQRTEQIDFEGQYGTFMMMTATGVSLVVFLIMYLTGDRRDARDIARRSWFLPMLAGLSNAMLNFFVILMASTPLSPSLIYPVLAVGSLSIVTMATLFLFKDKMRWWQWCGVALGAVATGILSL